MAEQERSLLLLSSSSHIAHPVNSQILMRNVLIALLPATVFGIALFGVNALVLILVSVAAAEIAEAVFRLAVRREPRVRDLSAAVTGLLLALTMPPGAPWWMAALGAVFAVVVVKEFFGGLGANVFNPALGGRAFLLTSFPAAMTTWAAPGGWGADAVTTATPLAARFVPEVAPSISAAFLGLHGGTVGETSALCILAGALFLALTKTIDLRTPLAMTGSAFILSAALGLDPVSSVLTGGLLFGAVFMATDYVSAPVTEGGKIVFGIGCGVITILIRRFGAYPEGVMYSILIMNAVAPFLNRILHKKYGFIKRRTP